MLADNACGGRIAQKMNIWLKTFEGKCEILRTMSKPRTLPANIPPSQKGVYLFNNPCIIFHIAHKLLVKNTVDVTVNMPLRIASIFYWFN